MIFSEIWIMVQSDFSTSSDRQTERMHMSAPCTMNRWAKNGTSCGCPYTYIICIPLFQQGQKSPHRKFQIFALTIFSFPRNWKICLSWYLALQKVMNPPCKHRWVKNTLEKPASWWKFRIFCRTFRVLRFHVSSSPEPLYYSGRNIKSWSLN